MLRDISEFKIDQIARSYAVSPRPLTRSVGTYDSSLLEKPQSKTKIALHGSYPSALSLNDLIRLSDGKPNPVDPDTPLSYAPSLGSKELRQRLAEIHSTPEAPLAENHVVITPGSIMANYLVLATTLGPGDHAICQFPTYGQLYLLPRHLGVEVTLWVMKEGNSWIPDIEELEKLIQPNTKAIILNNPNNPTGATLAGDTLEKVRSLAQQHDLTLIGDEVFRPLFHTSSPSPPSAVSLGYRKSVSTGSVSKAYSLPGIRIGWIISPDPDIITQVTNARDYTTLNVSRVDDSIAAFALSPAVLPRLIERNLEICALNLKSLDDLIARNPEQCAWTRPTGACTAFVRLRDSERKLVDDFGFSQRLIDETGISVTPGDSCFGEEGVIGFRSYIRISLGQQPSLFAEALGKIEVLIRSL